MGRMHSKGKGMSSSAIAYKRTPPAWLKVSAQDVDENICKFAKKGLAPSHIGVILRDSHGIAEVKSVTGSKILRILKAHVDGVLFVVIGVVFTVACVQLGISTSLRTYEYEQLTEERKCSWSDKGIIPRRKEVEKKQLLEQSTSFSKDIESISSSS